MGLSCQQGNPGHQVTRSVTELTRCGEVAIAGRPNAGKSSLLNALIGQPLAMVSAKAQASRVTTVGLLTQGDTQFVFQDLPGLLEPSYLLHQRMLDVAVARLKSADVVVYLHPADEEPAPPLATLLPSGVHTTAPVLLCYTKSDLALPARRDRLAAEAIVVSATGKQGLEGLLAAIRDRLPLAPWRYPDDDIGTQPVRFFVGEYLREAAFELLSDEVPYSFASEVEEFRETTDPIYIRATLYVERDSQKGILVGAGGRTIKALGQHARRRLEDLLGTKVFLETWVKVLPKWRQSPEALNRLGLPSQS